jgi:hypothetical protein
MLDVFHVALPFLYGASSFPKTNPKTRAFRLRHLHGGGLRIPRVPSQPPHADALTYPRIKQIEEQSAKPTSEYQRGLSHL